MFNVDNGPSCPICGSTKWDYRFSLYGSALCGSETCGHSEGPLRFDATGELGPTPKSAEEAVSLHLAFRAVSQ